MFISASSGVGKSAVIGRLKELGYTAYDADDRELELTRLELRNTGEPVDWPNGYVDWHHYAWRASEERLISLLSDKDTVFIGGFVDNQEKLYHYFDKLIALTIDPVEHERRLRARPKREHGDDEKNIQRRLDQYNSFIEKFLSAGFILVDNSGSVEDTVKKILDITD